MKFEFKRYSFDQATGVVSLCYAVGEHEFVEEFGFEVDRFVDFDAEVLDRALFYLHVACGVSYWKAFCPADLQMSCGDLTVSEAKFFTEFYKQGLMQFFYENDLDPDKFAVNFDSDSGLKRQKFVVAVDEPKVLLALGGGKDSLVSEALLEEAGVDFEWFCVKSDRIKEDCASKSGRELLAVERKFSSALIELNRKGEVFNGHVPISGILAFVKVLACVLYGYNTVVMSNEHSSSQGNLNWKGYNVNHQYSKSLDFEKAFRELLSENFVSNGKVLVNYFSLLRGFTEYKIAEIFAERCQKYFGVFSSCNRNFHLDKSKNLKGARFCGECEKCAFVFLMLSNFLSMDDLIKVFGSNLFESRSLFKVYEEMFELGDKKPWECVGTFEESRYAARVAMEQGCLSEELEAMVARFKVDPEFVEVYRKEFDGLPDYLKKFNFWNL